MDQFSDKLPNFSKLRNSGTLIRNHYTAVGCSPSRGMLLTGRNSEKTGFNYLGHLCYDTFLDDSIKFMPQYFKEHGYKTFHVGKWHVGSAKWSQTPTGRGFDESYHSLGGYLDYWLRIRIVCEIKIFQFLRKFQIMNHH